MDKQEIVDFLHLHAHTDDEDYVQVMEDFFVFLLEFKTKYQLDKMALYEILTEIIVDTQCSEWIYNITTDAMDYFVGWHSPLMPIHFAYDFVQQLNSDGIH